jgi:selenocysteine lyase/cysteine desulfurase
VRLRRAGKLEGVRVSPHIYILKQKLDAFVTALQGIARSA